MKLFKKIPFLLLLSILALAVFLRVFGLDKVPPELFGDELDVGYHAYSLWQSGEDYLGQKLPLYIHSLNEWRAPLLMYVTAPFVAAFGLNEWGVRLTPAIFGVLNVFLIFLLVNELSQNTRLALIAAFVCAVLPWHIHYSRAAFEVTLLLSLVLLGTIAFLKRKWFLAAVGFALSFYTYNTANVFVPLLLVGLLLVVKPRVQWQGKRALASLGLMVFLSLPLLNIILRGEGATRFRSLNIFNNPQTIDEIVFKRTTGSLEPETERIFHNKLTGWSKSFFANYLTSFSPQFLFIGGDPNPRHNLPQFGELSWWMLPFLLLGAIKLLQSKEERLKKFTFLWLLLSPISSALTVSGGEHATRLFLMIPALVILIAFGLYQLRSKFFWLIVLLAFASLGFWLHEYFGHYPKEQSQYWEVGYQEALVWLKENQDSFSRVILNNNHDPILLRYLFWTEKSPEWLRVNYQGDVKKKDLLPGFDGFEVDRVYFGGISSKDKGQWLRENLDEKTIYLAFQKDEVPGDWNWEASPPAGIKVLKTIKNSFSQEPEIYLLTREQ